MRAVNVLMSLLLGLSATQVRRQADGKFWWRRGPNQGPQRDIDSAIAEVFGQEAGTDDDDCECVPYYLCQNDTIITNGEGLIDIRLRTCGSYLDVCCKRPLDEPIRPIPLPRLGCGNRHPNGAGFRIIGDEANEAQFGEFPWMVALLRQETIDEGNSINVYQCGGALIHPQIVLTAAHCIQSSDSRPLIVRAGEWDTQTTEEIYPHQDQGVAEVVVHERYYGGALYYDVALLVLEEPFQITDNVDVVCLPDQGAVFNGNRCFASGWGKDVFGMEGQYQVILKKVDLPVVPHETCQESLRRTRLGRYFRLHESFICAGGEPNRDTCKGDGGSPLVCSVQSDPNRYVQAGIVAWGIGCGEDSTPGVYVNVPLMREWIDNQLMRLGLNTT